MSTLPQLREQVLGLSERERAELALDLIRSLDGEPDPSAARKWAAEIERRAREVLDGTGKLVDGDQALARARARLVDRRK